MPIERLRSCARSGILAVIFGVAACTSRGPIDDPLASGLTWYSYLDADDIRSLCREGAPDAWRAIYHGVEQEPSFLREQFRVYEIAFAGDGSAQVQSRIHGRAELTARFDITDPLGPWRAQVSNEALSIGDAAALRAAFAESGAFGPSPVGLSLPSWRFYWIVAGCNGGRFSYTAFLAPEPPFARLTFPAKLFALDRTDVRVFEAMPTTPEYMRGIDDQLIDRTYQLKIRNGGLVR